MRADTPSRKKRRWPLDSTADEQLEGHPDVVTEKRKVRHLRRISKRGEKALRHMSESLQKDSVSEKELEITRQVVEGVSNPPPPETAVPEVPTFTCFQCGTRIPMDSSRCPNCRILYVRDLKGEAIEEVPTPKDETLINDGRAEAFKGDAMSFANFDVVTGVVTCLRAEEGETDFGLECQNCGAVTQFGTDRCPLCGHSFDEWDTGLVGLLEGLKFDLDEDMELDCPVCGEHVVIDNDRCPSCKEKIAPVNRRDPNAVVLTILKEKDVLFVHLDVLGEDLRFAQKMMFRKTSEIPAIHLDSVGKSGFDHEWKSLARI